MKKEVKKKEVKKEAVKEVKKEAVKEVKKEVVVKRRPAKKTCDVVYKVGQVVKMDGFEFTVMEVTGNKLTLKDRTI